MVCGRCKMVVQSIFEKYHITPRLIELGEVEMEDVSNFPYEKIKIELQQAGFDILDDQKSKIIEKIKLHIIQLIHEENNDLKTNLSDYLVNHLNHDYSALSSLFSEVENSTIEKFYILQKVEKVKELLTYNELTIQQIADYLNYSSAAHLSNQFKKVTGFSPSYYKQLKEKKRKQIDGL